VSFARLVLATHNDGKVRELRDLLGSRPNLTISTLEAFPKIGVPDEPYDSFLENARHKAEYTARELGLPALADDSGLCVGHMVFRGLFPKADADALTTDAPIDGAADRR
jgi:XTP/dITP diphosphohydrolase